MVQRSEVWRISGSPIDRIEGANILRSLQRAVTALGMDKVQVQYAREGEASQTDGKRISIEPTRYIQSETKPIPSSDFDVMVGYAVHEVGHIASQGLTVQAAVPTTQALNLLQAVSVLGEEYVADNYYEGVARGYVINARQAELGSRVAPYVETGNLVLDAVSAFNHIVLYNDPVQMSPEVTEVFAILSRYMGEALQHKNVGYARCDVYQKAAEALKPYWGAEVSRQAGNNRIRGDAPSNQGAPRARDRDQASSQLLEQVIPLLGEADMQEPSKRLSDGDYEAIAASIETGERDITSELERLLGDKWADVESTVERWVTHDVVVKPNEDMVKALAMFRVAIERHGYVRERFRPRGRVDTTRLYRTALDDAKVFRRQKRQPIKPRRIWLVVDGSGSMSGSIGSYLYGVAAAFQQRIPDSRVYYYDCGNEVVITRADRGGELIEVPPRGGTPSGSAVLHVAHELEKAGGGTLIHLTDGQANGGVPVDIALQTILEKTDVDVVNLMPSNGVRQYETVEDKRIVNIPYSNPATFGETIIERLKEVWGLH